jgi:hypothetical protein
MPDTADTVIWTPDDEWSYHSKHVEQFTNINKLYIVASSWTIIVICLVQYYTRICGLPTITAVTITTSGRHMGVLNMV